MNKRKWVSFESNLIHKSGEPIVSIYKDGKIGFNRAATEQFELAKYRFAKLHYEPDEKLIGFQLTNKKNIGYVVKILVNRNSTTRLSAKSFLQYFQITHDETQQYRAEFDKSDQLVIIHLNENE